jgi:hypothetical protein
MTRRRPANPIRRVPRLSESELIEEAHKALIAGGVQNHLRAQFVYGLANAAVGHKSPLLNHLQARFLPARTIAWKRAYEIAIQFLDENNLICTRGAFDIESPDLRRQHVVCVTPNLLHALLGSRKERQLRSRESSEIIGEVPPDGSPIRQERTSARKPPPKGAQHRSVSQPRERPRPLSPSSGQRSGGRGAPKIALQLDSESEASGLYRSSKA